MHPPAFSRPANALLAGLFVAALWVPLLGLRQAPPTAMAEKRLPATWPGLPRTGAQAQAFPGACEAYFNDHFGLRDALIRTHARVCFFALRTSPSPKAILGRNGFIFLRGRPEDDGTPIADHRGTSPLSAYELERWRWQLEDEAEWLRARGVTFLFAVAPGKETMASNCLPPGFDNIGRPSTLEQFVTHLAPRATYPFLDLTPALRTVRDSSRGFRRTDTHWNDDGAWAAIRAMTDALRADYPALPTPDTLDLVRTRAWYHEGDMGNVIGLPGEIGEWLDWVRPRHPRATPTRLREHHLADIVTDTADDRLPDAVLFHDSFGHYLKPLFGEHFRRLRFCWSNAGLEHRVVAAHAPRLVIHLMGERRIRMGQRYSTGLQQAGNQVRFERAATLPGGWEPGAGPAPLAPDSDTLASMEPGGLALQPRSRPVAWTWPAIPETARVLPILRLAFHNPRANDLAMTWTTASADFKPDFVSLAVKAPVPAGEAVVYLPLLDPEATGPLTFRFGHPTGPIILRSVEIRGVPRD